MNQANKIPQPRLQGRFEDALQLATQLHANQVRKGTNIPYVSHLLAVASMVLEAGGDEDEAIAALLHDAVEDQGGQPVLQDIRQRFGDRVAEIVDGCTDAYGEPKPPWRERKEAYIAHLSTASASVLLVSISDKTHNARAILADYRRIGEDLWGRFSGGRDGTLWYYRELVKAYRANNLDRLSELVDEFDRIVSALEPAAG